MKQAKPLPQWRRFGYASGNFAKSIQWRALDLIYLYFLVDIVGVRPAVAGGLLLASLVWDGISDPGLGYLLDRYKKALGHYRRILLITAPISAVSYALLFALPVIAPGPSWVWALIGLVLFRTGYTLVDVPHNSMLASLTDDSRVRATLSTYRYVFSAIAGITLSIAIAPALAQSTETDPSAFILLSLAAGIPYIGIIWLAAVSAPRKTRTTSNEYDQIGLFQSYREIFSNRQIILVVFLGIASALLISVFKRVTLFYSMSWLGDPIHASLLLFAYMLGEFLALWFWLWLAHSTEKKITSAGAHSMLAIITLLFLIFPPISPILAAVFFAGVGFAFSGINTMNWAILPDLIEYTEKETGRRHEALTFGTYLLVIKISAGLSLALIGWTLDVTGYHQEHTVAGDSSMGILLVMTITPIVGAVLGAIAVSRLKLTHIDHANHAQTPAQPQ